MAENMIKGVTYFRVKQGEGYENDKYKEGKGLSGGEIDSNFLFLRGNDIKSLELGKDNVLRAIKYNNEKIEIQLTDKYEFAYDPNTGEIEITPPDGSDKIAIRGFVTDVKIREIENNIGRLISQINGYLENLNEIKASIENIKNYHKGTDNEIKIDKSGEIGFSDDAVFIAGESGPVEFE